MAQRIFTAVGAVVLGLFMTPVVAIAGIGLPAPEIANETWLNASPTRMADLRGKVVMVEFWTFGCYNCRNVEPYVKAWHRKYRDQGFVVIGVHSPEFNYERDVEKVRRYLQDHGIDYPVPIDNDFTTWSRYGNRYWPAMYLIDKRGIVRYVRIGEGGYRETERLIQRLLAEGE
ncbi:MAG: redoxin domain-containing protein [Nitrospirota bacterium]